MRPVKSPACLHRFESCPCHNRLTSNSAAVGRPIRSDSPGGPPPKFHGEQDILPTRLERQSVCIQTNSPRSFADRHLRPGGMLPQNAGYDDRRPCGTRPCTATGSSPAWQFSTGPGSLGRRGPMMTRRSAE